MLKVYTDYESISLEKRRIFWEERNAHSFYQSNWEQPSKSRCIAKGFVESLYYCLFDFDHKSKRESKCVMYPEDVVTESDLQIYANLICLAIISG